MSALGEAIETATRPARLQLCLDELDDATHRFAGQRMNRAIAAAIAGRNLMDVEKTVEHAAGVDAHLLAHGHPVEEESR